VQYTADRHFYSKATDKVRLDQATFVVTLFMPWVREIDLNTIQGLPGKTVFQHHGSIALHHFQVAQTALMNGPKDCADTGWMYVDPNVVPVRMLSGHLHQGIAHPETDLENQGCLSSKNRIQINNTLIDFQPVERPEPIHGILLGGCQASTAHHVATNRTMLLHR